VGVFLHHLAQVIRVPIPVFGHVHQAVVQRPVFRGPRIGIAGLPILVDPVDAPGVVEVVGDVVEEPGLRIVVEVEVVLVAGVIVPVGVDHVEGLHLEVIGHVEDFFERTGQVCGRRIVQDVDEVGEVGVIVFVRVGLELVCAAPIDLELV